MILSLSDPGGKKGGDKKSCHVRIESMLGSGGAQENRDVGVGVGGRDNCDIHTHAHSQRVADG